MEYLSKTVLSGARPYELEILKRFMKQKVISMDEMIDAFEKKGYLVDLNSLENAVDVLRGHFVSKDDEYQKYSRIDILDKHEEKNAPSDARVC